MLPKPLLLGLLAVALVLRFGPFCETAMAAPQPVAMAMEGCHELPSPTPAPDKHHPVQMSCLTPCAVLAPTIAPVAAIVGAEGVDAPAPLRILAGASLPPEDPPPRLG